MPKIVDHDRRRDVIVERAIAIIAKDGLDATLNRIAKAAGFTTGMLQHYYKSKDELLIDALERASEAVNERAMRIAVATGFDPVEILMCSLPTDAKSRAEWLVRIAFSGRAVHQPEVAAAVERRFHNGLAVMRLTLAAFCEYGYAAGPFDTETAAENLVVFIDGLAQRAALEPHRWPEAKLRAHVRQQLELWGIRRRPGRHRAPPISVEDLRQSYRRVVTMAMI